MNAEIITVGTEIMFGDTIDTHSSFLSQECRKLGIPVLYHTSIDDEHDRLRAQFALAASRSDLVLVCGGLGPTMDDITKEVLAGFLGVQMIQDPDVTNQLEMFFKKRKHMPTNNYRQAYVFPQGTVFPNDNGTAPGLSITMNKTTYVLMPGPPKELKPMFTNYVRPFLIKIYPETKMIVHQDLSFFGIGESMLEDKLKDLIQHADNPTLATYIFESGVILRMTGVGIDEASIEQRFTELKKAILARVGEYCYSEQKETLEGVVIAKLADTTQTLACAENLTGGLLTCLLTAVAGSESVLRGGIVKNEMAGMNRPIQKPAQTNLQLALQLAEDVMYQFGTNFSLSITGVGNTVYIAIAQMNHTTQVYQFSFQGTKQRIQQAAARHALFILQQRLKKGEASS